MSNSEDTESPAKTGSLSVPDLVLQSQDCLVELASAVPFTSSCRPGSCHQAPSFSSLMGPRGLLSWNVLLFLSLAFERSCGTGCPTIFGRLGSSVLLPPVSDGISKSMNKSIYILITKAESPENRSSKKIVSLKLPEGGPSSHLENGYRFYPENLSLEILESEKEHEGWYTMTLEEIHSVQRFCLQLKLYEQVSAPEIMVLNRTMENGNCSVVLACTLEKGDHVVYSWSTEAGTHPLSAANASHPLYLTLGPQHADDKYICSVSNPISNRSQTFTPWSSCSSSSPVPRQWGLHVGLLLGGIIGVILIGQVVILLFILFRRRGHTDHYKPTVEATNLTIYAQVQKSGSVQKKPDPLPAQDPCTTIYVAAAEPAPEPAQKPSSITVYASVTLPES